MANQIRMTPQLMRDRAKEVDRRKSEMEALIHKMDKLLSTLEGEWEGDAIAGYRERYNKIKNTAFKNSVELFIEISHNLTETARIVEETDKNIASQFRK